MDGSKMKDYKEQKGLIEYIEKQSQSLDEQEISISPIKMATASNQYISCIKFSGIPILPPVMTAKRKDEMKNYRYQAQIAENKIKSRQRDRLMARAHRAVKTIQTTEVTNQYSDEEEKSKNLTAELERVQSLAKTGQFEEAIQSIDSLSSGLISLEDGSLPKDFYGLPCTSVHEQQISQVLQKLSKQLNLKDTLSSTPGSTLGSDGNVDTLTEQKNNLKIPDAVSEGSSNSFRDSQDTIVEVLNTSRKSKPPAIKIEDKPEGSVKDSPSCGYGSGDSSAVNSANTSTSERMRGSPKSLKNTVHFSEFVKVLKTNQSVEDEITVKRLEEMNPISESKDKKSPELKVSQSLLSKVNLSLENEATSPSPDSILEVPFQPKADLSKKTNESLPSKNTLQKVLEDKPPKPGYVSPKISPSCGSDPGSRSSRSSTPVRRAASLKFNKPRRSDTCENSQSSSLHSSPHSQTSSSDNMSSQTTDTSSRLTSTGQSQSTGCLSQTADTQNSSQQRTKSQNNTQSTTRSSSNSFSTQTSRTTNEQLTSVTDSQISARTDFTLETTDSENTIKADDGHVGSSTGSSNLLRYKKAIENTLDNSDTDVSKSQLESVTESADCELLHNDLSANAKAKGHVRRGSYTLDNPSPVLIHAQSRIDKEGGGTLGVETSIYAPVIGNPGINKPIQRKLDYDEDPDLENTRPVSLPIPPGQESEGKEEHIHRYLNHVQQQNKQPLKQQGPILNSQTELSEYSTLNSINILHSLIEEINNTPDMSDEELFKLQREKFQAMHQGLLEKQRNDLEELFVMQRRQQINLQSEIDCHKKVVEKPHPGRKSATVYSSPDQYCDETDIRNISLQSHSSVLYPTGSNNRPLDKSTPKNLLFPKTSTPTPKVYKPLVRSPVKSVNPVYRPNYPVKLPPDINDIETQLKFFKVTALARGFLTRRLLKSEKVQELIKTIRDTREFAFSFQSETPIKSGSFSNQDRNLLERIIAQLQAALLDVHEIFFVLPVSDRMELIRQTRLKEQERRYLGASSNSMLKDSARKVSSATLKAIERKKKAQEEESQTLNRPKTAPPSTSSPRCHSTNIRALKPLQSQISPIRKDDINNRTNKVRPKTAPEKPTKEQLASKNRKVNNAAPTTIKPNKTPASNNKSVTKIIRKVSSKSDKSWR